MFVQLSIQDSRGILCETRQIERKGGLQESFSDLGLYPFLQE